jgi:hypothetical protein
MSSAGGPPPPPDPVEPGLVPLVELAVADLAGMLGIDRAGVTVVSARAVTWPDTGLGCHRPGMRYRQVPQDGSLIVLEAAGGIYRYHSGGHRTVPFWCPQ